MYHSPFVMYIYFLNLFYYNTMIRSISEVFKKISVGKKSNEHICNERFARKL